LETGWRKLRITGFARIRKANFSRSLVILNAEIF